MKIVLDDGSEITLDEFIEAGKNLGPVIQDEIDYEILTKLRIAAIEHDINLPNKGVE